MRYRLNNAKSVLETTTTIAVLLVAALILGSFLATQFRKPATVQAGLTVGKSLTEIPGVSYSAAQRTMLLALSTKCAYCEKGIPFFKELIRANQQSNKPFKLIAVFPDRPAEVQEYLHNNGLNIEARAEVRLNEMSIPGTPTLILIGPDRTIENFWVGEVSQPTQQRVLQMLTES